MYDWIANRFMITKRLNFYLALISFSILMHFAQNLPPSTAVDLTSVIALTSDLRPPGLAHGEKNNTQKEDGAVCVFNTDCMSGCCMYATSASGMCVAKAIVGQICGFVYGADKTLDTHYRVCQQCETQCCCGTGCCPADYCASALQLKPFVCTSCNTGCCCNNTGVMGGYTSCCPITFCLSTGGLKETAVKAKVCLRCQSGCCCGENCCVSSFCKAQVDSSALNIARTLLAMYDIPKNSNPNAWPVATSQNEYPMTMAGDNSQSSLASSIFPVLAPAQLRVLGGGIMGSRIKAFVCIQCTTGCCCEVGCCNYIYCSVKYLQLHIN